jgi:hypothetical protein
MNQEDPFWIDYPTILLDKHRLIEFVPTEDMSVNEKLNAVTRFLVYLGVLIAIVYKTTTPLYIPIIGCAVVYLAHEHYPNMQKGGNSSGALSSNNVQLPSAKNPFMNVLMTDYIDNPQRKPAGDIDLPAVRDSMDKHFSQGLYKDINNVWDRNNSQRQYYTNPSTTIPNDRDSFMKWCWKTPYTCKDGNLLRCLKYQDVRGHGQIHSQ